MGITVMCTVLFVDRITELHACVCMCLCYVFCFRNQCGSIGKALATCDICVQQVWIGFEGKLIRRVAVLHFRKHYIRQSCKGSKDYKCSFLLPKCYKFIN